MDVPKASDMELDSGIEPPLSTTSTPGLSVKPTLRLNSTDSSTTANPENDNLANRFREAERVGKLRESIRSQIRNAVDTRGFHPQDELQLVEMEASQHMADLHGFSRKQALEWLQIFKEETIRAQRAGIEIRLAESQIEEVVAHEMSHIDTAAAAGVDHTKSTMGVTYSWEFDKDGKPLWVNHTVTVDIGQENYDKLTPIQRAAYALAPERPSNHDLMVAMMCLREGVASAATNPVEFYKLVDKIKSHTGIGSLDLVKILIPKNMSGFVM